jgi:putative ABC transport system ATP-binding protein
MSLLKAENITKIYELGDNKIYALNDVSLEIKKGELLGIIGKSGSGKSTLMHILGLLDTPTSGKVLLNDKDISDLPEKKLADVRNQEIGFVFQSFNLLARTTALENVMLPLQYSERPRSEWRAKAEEMLKLVELGDRMLNKSNELSGGQKQRVAIARALVNDPSIIFADEPTGNLDSRTGDEIEKLLSKLNEQGKTIVLVTHDEDLADIAKRKVILHDGKIQR